MICRCPKCDGALRYNPEHKKMKCPFCGGIFKPQEAVKDVPKTQPEISSATANASVSKEGEVKYQQDSEDMMECNLYSCSSCGGELLVNGVESSTFCAYCGQPGIVFKRVSKELKPKWILPFRVTKNQAMDIFRKRVEKCRYLPKEAGNVEPDKVRGIYVPYFIQDIYYRSKVHYFAGNKLYVREGECTFHDMYLEASSCVDDITSQYLEPFYLKELQPFDASYLSGFYADKFDVDYKTNAQRYVFTIRNKFNYMMHRDLEVKNYERFEDFPHYEIKRNEYALLPVWFITFRYKNEPYTMMINGQTGKIVGSLPIDDSKIRKQLILFTLLFALITFPFFFLVTLLGSAGFGLGFCIALIFGCIGGIMFWATYREVKMTRNRKMKEYVENRQEEEA